MHPETVIAFARMSEINRPLSDPRTFTHRYDASRLHAAARRGRRRAFVAHIRRAMHTTARGRQVGGPAAA